ncbi:MAG: hypothetical protein ACRDHE_05750 [Ktedonobacterales bacterium]
MLNAAREMAGEPTPEPDEHLNIAERMVAIVGAWAGSLAARYQSPAGPFFVADGRPAHGNALSEPTGTDGGIHPLL